MLNGSSYSNSEDKATAFNTYLSSVFNTDTSIPGNLPTSPYKESIASTLEFSHEEVASATQCLNVSTWPGRNTSKNPQGMCA